MEFAADLNPPLFIWEKQKADILEESLPNVFLAVPQLRLRSLDVMTFFTKCLQK